MQQQDNDSRETQADAEEAANSPQAPDEPTVGEPTAEGALRDALPETPQADEPAAETGKPKRSRKRKASPVPDTTEAAPAESATELAEVGASSAPEQAVEGEPAGPDGEEPVQMEGTAQEAPVGQEPAVEAEAGAGESQAEAEPGEAIDEGEEAEEETADDRLADGLLVKQVIEALLLTTDVPLPASKIAQVLERGTSRQVRKYIQQLNEQYEQAALAFRIEEVAGGYQMLTLPAFQPWLAKLLRARQESRLSPTQMETLAIIAYKQPVLRADVEVVRGVACGDVINRLRELGLVKIVGRAEDVGRPLLYGTTKKFLRVFGLGSLEDLPRVEEFKAPEAQAAAQPQVAQPQQQEAMQSAAQQEPVAAEQPQEPPEDPAQAEPESEESQ